MLVEIIVTVPAVPSSTTDHTPPTSAAHPSRPAQADSWTAERIRALGTVTTVPVAASIFGLSRSVAYDLVRTDQFPVPVLRFGSRYRIPVAAILTALHMTADRTERTRLDSIGTHASINPVKSAATCYSNTHETRRLRHRWQKDH